MFLLIPSITPATALNMRISTMSLIISSTQTSHTETPEKADNQTENRRSIMLQHMKMAMTYADKQVFWSKTCSKARKFVHQSNAAIP